MYTAIYTPIPQVNHSYSWLSQPWYIGRPVFTCEDGTIIPHYFEWVEQDMRRGHWVARIKVPSVLGEQVLHFRADGFDLIMNETTRVGCGPDGILPRLHELVGQVLNMTADYTVLTRGEAL